MSTIDKLLKVHQDLFLQSISHPLTNELCEGTLADYKLFTYLNQDLKFFQIGLNLFGKTLAYCDDPKSAIILGKQIGFVSTDENDYFIKTLKELEQNEDLIKVVINLKEENLTLVKVQQYIKYLQYLTFESNSYVEIITFMYTMEKVYLGWAEYNIARKAIPSDLPYKYQEWINLHYGLDFTKWVQFLHNEVERVVKTKEDFNICEKSFVKCLELEIDFFQACYEYQEN
ncbi:protein Pet18 homologue, putative [Candida dubliniensis CD36]|uniref:Protein Pet18 homologue, putative n=1 Tax=Candida dubliniensis (strain CD36 / ATCC MYA-646 / CBS 7987 / NCPF 3949 / NRRL Y-17841) TaxID=573826 RepID=B9WMU8_CANDC|nr:protein Pet18 homologue, putative [Candida dubliniensis CD36]CAX40414.1 protein Pet18 homologue, putative [Candida dubliniensis CD36]